MKLNSRFSFIGAALLISLFTGCGPAWKVIKVSGPPSALAGATDVALAFDYSQMMVEGRTEAAWMAEKTAAEANYPTTWADLKGKFEAAVLEGLQGEYPSAHPVASGPGAVTVVVQVRTFKLGKFIPMVMPPTIMDASIAFQVGGQTTDEISLVRSYPSSLTQPSVFNHIPYVGRQLGQAGGKLIASKK